MTISATSTLDKFKVVSVCSLSPVVDLICVLFFRVSLFLRSDHCYVLRKRHNRHVWDFGWLIYFQLTSNRRRSASRRPYTNPYIHYCWLPNSAVNFKSPYRHHHHWNCLIVSPCVVAFRRFLSAGFWRITMVSQFASESEY